MDFNDIKKVLTHWITRNVLLAVLFFVMLGLVSNAFLGILTRHGETVIVPDFTNMTVQQASAAASEANVRIKVTDSIFVRRLEKGVVYRQTPKAGEAVKKKRHISLTINSIVPQTVFMPNLVGCSLIEAKAELTNKGLSVGRLQYVDDIATNVVLKQFASGRIITPGTKIISGSEIDLQLGRSQDNDKAVVPKVTGLRYTRALDVLTDNSLNRGRTIFDKDIRTYADSVSAVVWRQDPVSSESVTMGTGVTLYLTLDSSKVPQK